MKKIRQVLLITILSFLMLSNGCQKPLPEKRTMTYLEYFDTVALIIGYDDDQERFQNTCEHIREIFEKYHQLSDIYHIYTDINNIRTINKAAGEKPVEVSKELLDMLLFAREMYSTTNGMFDISMGCVLSIWHNYRTDGIDDPLTAKIPPMDKLKEAAKHGGWEHVIIDETNSTVFLEDDQMSLDLGAIAKGYAIERAAEYLESNGLNEYTLNVGGNVRTISNKPDGSDWYAGIQNPDLEKNDDYVVRVKLNGMSLVTSGTYQRFYVVDGRKYHHIIHPQTLMPEFYFESVSILTKDSGFADCMSTALFNMTLDDGMTFINSLEDTEAFWIFSDGSYVSTEGFKHYIVD